MISIQEKQKGKGDILQHRWLFEETLAFSREMGGAVARFHRSGREVKVARWRCK